MRERVLWHFSYLQRVQGVLDGVRRGPVGPPGSPELAALISTEAGRQAVRAKVSRGARREARALVPKLRGVATGGLAGSAAPEPAAAAPEASSKAIRR